eukprot:3731341-Alexandrium_andersonii.AAC.1
MRAARKRRTRVSATLRSEMVFGVGALHVGASATSRVAAHVRRRTCRRAPNPGVSTEVAAAGSARDTSAEGAA